MQDTSITKGYDLSMFMSINEDGSLSTINENTGLGIQDLYGSIKDDSVREKIEKLIEDYTSEWSDSQDKLEGLRDTIDDIEDLEKDGQEAFYELRDMAKEAILDSL
jgi:septation ring formation regulator EzrA